MELQSFNATVIMCCLYQTINWLNKSTVKSGMLKETFQLHYLVIKGKLPNPAIIHLPGVTIQIEWMEYTSNVNGEVVVKALLEKQTGKNCM